MKTLLHIITSDKFTIGYIKYMLRTFKDIQHTFLFIKTRYVENLSDDISKYSKKVNEVNELFSDKDLLYSADKVIVSGLFGLEEYLFFLPNKLLKKMYFQFWGGDFYSYRNTKLLSRRKLYKMMLHSCIKRCGGILNLIDDDYKELSKIFPNKNKHYTMIMPDDPDNLSVYDEYALKTNKKKRILLGNSATEENCHIEILKKLKHLKDEKMEIICPLSYGDKEYAKKIISIGNKIYGKKFIPITDYMTFDKYLRLISSCSVAIFNNNRQQAMGNINAMLTFGKKVYIRNTTPMWKEYNSNNILIYDVEKLNNISFDDLFKFDQKSSIINNKNMKLREKNRYDNLKKVINLIMNN